MSSDFPELAPGSPSHGRLVQDTTKPVPRLYGVDFWLCYVANALLMLAMSILFRYADFINYLGGGERELGTIVGVGMVGALATRAMLGVGIDRQGPRRIWLLSLGLFSASTLAHMLVSNIHGPLVYLLRILLTTGLAGSFGASLTYVSLRVPKNRIAEVVGTLGTSGFLGLALGPVLGDLLFGSGEITRLQIDRMFLMAAVAGGMSLVGTAIATRLDVHSPASRRHPPWITLVRRYHPGSLLLVAAALGLAVGLPSVFLRPFTLELGIGGIRSFFLVYAAVAFAVRLCTRRLSEQIGIRRVILLGLTAESLSMVLYLFVHDARQLALPAVAAGTGHALLFPAIVAGGSISFPSRYRGLATTLVVGMLDVGNLLGQPAVGNTLYYAGKWGLPKYATMFLLVAAFEALVAMVFFVKTRQKRTPNPATKVRVPDEPGQPPCGPWRSDDDRQVVPVAMQPSNLAPTATNSRSSPNT